MVPDPAGTIVKSRSRRNSRASLASSKYRHGESLPPSRKTTGGKDATQAAVEFRKLHQSHVEAVNGAVPDADGAL